MKTPVLPSQHDQDVGDVWLLTSGEPLPEIDGAPRPLRTGLLAEAFRKAGRDVIWWSARFNHTTKNHRLGPSDRKIQNGIRIRLLSSPGYESNHSPWRVKDHVQLALNMRWEADRVRRPKIIVASFPPIELAAAAVSFGRKNGVPVVVDVRDLWPDLLREGMSGFSGSLGRLGALAYGPLARWTLRNATALTSITTPMLAWGLQKAGRERAYEDSVFPFAYSPAPPSVGAVEQATRFWHSLGVNGRHPTYCYSGSINDQLDVEMLLSAHEALKRVRPNASLVICGTGDRFPYLESAAQHRDGLICAGWIGNAEIWALLRLSCAGIVPYRKRFDFELSVPNKVIEYMSAGLPVVSTLQGPTCALLAEHNCGRTVPYGDSDAMAVCMDELGEKGEVFQTLSLCGKEAFDHFFRSDLVYPKMVEHLLSLT